MVLQAWQHHRLMPCLLPWPTRCQSHKVGLGCLSLKTWQRTIRTTTCVHLNPSWACLHALSGCTEPRAPLFWDEGNVNQESCASGNGGMRGVTLPPCGELPLETNGERWLTSKLWAARTSPHCCVLMAGQALVPLL